MSKYSPLRKFLSLHRENKVTLTLEQIEIIINEELPKFARKYDAWWRGPADHPHVENWVNIGWKIQVHHDKGRVSWVVFRKER
jgi:hypothetical protein